MRSASGSWQGSSDGSRRLVVIESSSCVGLSGCLVLGESYADGLRGAVVQGDAFPSERDDTASEGSPLHNPQLRPRCQTDLVQAETMPLIQVDAVDDDVRAARVVA